MDKTNKDIIAKCVTEAVNCVSEVKDPYNRGMLALSLVRAVYDLDACLSSVKKSAAKSEPVKDEASSSDTKVDVPEGTEIKNGALVMNVPDKKSKKQEIIPDKDDLENIPPLHNINPNAPVKSSVVDNGDNGNNDTATDKAKENTPKKTKVEIDINSDEWKNKILGPDELDEDWTPAMKANIQLVESAKRLNRICANGIKSGKVKPEWLNARISEATQGRFTTFKTRDIYRPKVVRLIEGYVSKKVSELFAKSAA